MKFAAVLLLSLGVSPAFAGPVRLGQCVGGQPKNEYCTGMWRFNIRRSEDGKIKIAAYGGSIGLSSVATWTVHMAKRPGELRFTDVKDSRSLYLRIQLSTQRTYHGKAHACVSKEHRNFQGSAGSLSAFKPLAGQDLKLDGFPVVCQWYEK